MTARPTLTAAAECGAQQHGTATAYDWWGCRCPEAREAHRIYRKRLRENRQPPALIPAVGTARRLQALVAFGYSWRDLSRRLGVSSRCVGKWATAADGTVYRSTAERVAEVFAELVGKPGPSRYARTVARRHGWLPPLAWDDIDDPEASPSLGSDGADIVDDVAVERVLAGEHLPLTDDELMVVLQLGVARGESLSRLSLRLGLNYVGAQTLLGGELTPRRKKAAQRRALREIAS